MSMVRSSFFVVIITTLTLIYSCQNPKNSKQKTDHISSNKITGIVRDAGLTYSHPKNKNTKQYEFQITSPAQSYYLYTNENLAHLQGKCITAHGSVIQSDLKDNDAYAFDRKRFLLERYTINDLETCSYEVLPHYEDRMKTILQIYKNSPAPRTLNGKVERNKRPAPDIAYDYKIKLSAPYMDNNNESGSPQEVHDIMVVPKDFDMIKNLEKRIDQDVKVDFKGYKIGGYVESTVFYLVDIEP